MTSKEGYDVLRLIEHNQSCYVSSEYVKGKQLIQWMKYHPAIPKEQLFQWIQDMVRQLAQIHKCRGKPCYQYVNPYSIIVTEDEAVYFLDLNAESNAGQLKKMQRRAVREYFLPPEENYYQQASVGLDIYGLGRTIQYLLAELEPEPELRKSEVVKFQRIISRCIQRHSKKTFQKVSDIQKHIPKYETKEKEKRKVPKWLLAAVIAIGIAVVVKTGVEGGKGQGEQEVQNLRESESKSVKKEDVEGKKYGEKTALDEEMELKMELGVLYFLEVQDYEKSRQYFESVKNSRLAENMGIIAGSMNGEKVSDAALRQALKRAEESVPEKETSMYHLCLLKGYISLDSQKDREEVLRIGEKCLDEGDAKYAPEIMGYMAAAYEKNGKSEEAVKMYERQMEAEVEEEEKEEIYLKIATLYERLGQADKAQEKLREGINIYKESMKLRILYIRIQCRDTSIDRKICVQTIETFLREVPGLEQEEEFQKLMKEYGWKTEGAKVWTAE